VSSEADSLSGDAAAAVAPARRCPRKSHGGAGRRFGAAVLLLLAMLAALYSLMPLIWATASALRPGEEIFRYLSPLSIWSLLPRHPTLGNLHVLWTGEFARAMANSLIVTSVTVVLGLLLCSAAAFALAVLRFPGRSVVFALMVVSFLIPFDSIAVPLATLFRGFNLQNTYTGLVLPGLGNGLAVFMLRQFFLGIPRVLSEAAMVDGLGWWGIYTRIYLPLSRPALIGAGLILFVFQWQSYLWPLLIAPAPQVHVVSVAIANFSTELGVDYGEMFAATTFAVLVPMLIMLFFQRYFAASLATSGMKE
jgi:multiple sugar transport system permease protein/putative chitobiose transport system permease protein